MSPLTAFLYYFKVKSNIRRWDKFISYIRILFKLDHISLIYYEI